MKIELVEPIPELVEKYRERVRVYLNLNLITLKEWNTKFKNYRDYCGYSIIHYLDAVILGLDAFITINPVLIKNRKELEKRFGLKISNPQEFGKEIRKK